MSNPDLGAAVRQHAEMIEQVLPVYLAEAREKLAGAPLTGARMASITAGMHRSIDVLVATSLANAARQGAQVGCKSGCGSCCHQPVSVSTVELSLLAESIRPEHHAEAIAECQSVIDRMGGNAFDSTRRFARAIACPLLDKGKTCAVYPYRPQACRTHFSLRRTACMTSWRRRGQSTRAGVHPVTVPMPTEPKAIGFALMAGLDAAVMERGIQVEMVELAEGLPRMLTRREAWLAGSDEFTDIRQQSNSGGHYSEMLAEVLAQYGKAQPEAA